MPIATRGFNPGNRGSFKEAGSAVINQVKGFRTAALEQGRISAAKELVNLSPAARALIIESNSASVNYKRNTDSINAIQLALATKFQSDFFPEQQDMSRIKAEDAGERWASKRYTVDAREVDGKLVIDVIQGPIESIDQSTHVITPDSQFYKDVRNERRTIENTVRILRITAADTTVIEAGGPKTKTVYSVGDKSVKLDELRDEVVTAAGDASKFTAYSLFSGKVTISGNAFIGKEERTVYLVTEDSHASEHDLSSAVATYNAENDKSIYAFAPRASAVKAYPQDKDGWRFRESTRKASSIATPESPLHPDVNAAVAIVTLTSADLAAHYGQFTKAEVTALAKAVREQGTRKATGTSNAEKIGEDTPVLVIDASKDVAIAGIQNITLSEIQVAQVIERIQIARRDAIRLIPQLTEDQMMPYDITVIAAGAAQEKFGPTGQDDKVPATKKAEKALQDVVAEAKAGKGEPSAQLRAKLMGGIIDALGLRGTYSNGKFESLTPREQLYVEAIAYKLVKPDAGELVQAVGSAQEALAENVHVVGGSYQYGEGTIEAQWKAYRRLLKYNNPDLTDAQLTKYRADVWKGLVEKDPAFAQLVSVIERINAKKDDINDQDTLFLQFGDLLRTLIPSQSARDALVQGMLYTHSQIRHTISSQVIGRTFGAGDGDRSGNGRATNFPPLTEDPTTR